jgi:uncharacterized protein YeaO (DUF488 family)
MPRESIHTKCVWSPMSSDDGIRILVTRFRGRGLPKTRYDLWLPSLGPSEELLAAFESLDWAEFSRRYKEELWLDGAVDDRNRTSKNHGQKGLLRTLRFMARRQRITLMCHCDEDEPHCHRHLLKSMIQSSKVTL